MSCFRGSKTKHRKINLKKPVSRFTYDGPSVSGDCYALFDTGLCYRVEGPRRTWYIYNDTRDSEMHICFMFGPKSGARKPKHAATTVSEVSGWIQCSVVVYPLQTVKFVTFSVGKVDSYKATCRSCPLNTDYMMRVAREARARELEAEQKVAKVAGTSHTVEEILYKCRKSDTVYVDLKFRPLKESLRRPSDENHIHNFEDIYWGRPPDFPLDEASTKVTLFGRRIDPSDVGQGMLGDCWLMSAISVIAKSSTLVKDLFRHPVSKSKQKKEQKVGAYRVRINKDGWWHSVIVDSYLPIYAGSLSFGCNRTDPHSLWVSLLEKAYAKVSGSYAAIIGGDTREALRNLTGFPVHYFKDAWNEAKASKQGVDALFKDLLRWRRAGYLICVSTPDEHSGVHDPEALAEHYREAGLRMNHAYSVVSVRQFMFPKIRLLCIRNPWGTGEEWAGAWGRGSDKWRRHPLVRRSCKPPKVSNGTFWMEWTDVARYFESGSVCMLNKSWHDYRFRGKFLGRTPSLVLRIDLRKTQKVTLTLSQKGGDRLGQEDTPRCKAALAIILSCYSAGNASQEVWAMSSHNPEVFSTEELLFQQAGRVAMTVTLEPAKGPYYVVPCIAPVDASEPIDFVLGMFTPQTPTVKIMRVSFVTLPGDCEVFRGFKYFTPPAPDKQIHTQFQYKRRGCVPRLYEGTALTGASRVKEAYPFPY